MRSSTARRVGLTMSTDTGKPIILCVDDEAPVLRLLKEWLAGEGCEVLTADSGAGALRAIENAVPDLILLDVVMPGMDGYELCAALQAQERTAQIPIVFVTAMAGEPNKAKAFAMGAVGYIVKPIVQKGFLDTVRAHLPTRPRWNALLKPTPLPPGGIQPADFTRFKNELAGQVQASPDKKALLAKTSPSRMYAASSLLGIDERKIAQALAAFLKLPYLAKIDQDVIRLGVLPASFCKTHSVVAVRDASEENAFILSNPFDWELLDALRRCTGPDQPPRLLITEPATIVAMFRDSEVGGAPAPSDAVSAQDYNLLGDVEPEGKAEADAEDEYEVLDAAQMAKLSKLPPIVRLINMVLSDAVKAGTSDIHVEPQENILQVRYRVDGALVDSLKIPKHLQPNVISRFKIIARLDIAEHRKPQDGRSRLRYGDRRIDLRVSTLPAQFGEKVVIRLLDSSKARIDMEQLGLAPDILVRFRRLLSSPQGMILVTGPTGSGKTSTLYASLNWLKSPTKNIITVEDPIEFQVPGLTQVQIDTKTGMTFAAGLRSILRQDPNIILVGEIRDGETASIALEASQTGHLLLSTLHTNDAVATITRLLDLGIEPFKVASSVIGILAQRLLRRVCPACAVEREPSPEVVEKAGGRGRLPGDARWKAGAGCDACQQSGYKGRLAIHELLEVTEEIRSLIARRAPDHEVRGAARRNGMWSLMEAGIVGAAHGLTTLEEVVRIAPRDDAPAARVDVTAPAADVGLRKGAEESRRETAPEAAGKKANVSVLVLEDDADTQALLKRILEKGGYETTVAGDGIEALLYLGKKDFDLILSDINMPNLDGIKLLELNNQKGIATPVIFLTAQSGEESEQKCLELGAVDYIKKPIQKDILLMRVDRACRRTVGKG
ncbi:MAG: response regulator [Nitrospirae bacterium]|nr:MAG: response regulator [Nitrospirota bacterium]